MQMLDRLKKKIGVPVHPSEDGLDMELAPEPVPPPVPRTNPRAEVQAPEEPTVAESATDDPPPLPTTPKPPDPPSFGLETYAEVLRQEIQQIDSELVQMDKLRLELACRKDELNLEFRDLEKVSIAMSARTGKKVRLGVIDQKPVVTKQEGTSKPKSKSKQTSKRSRKLTRPVLQALSSLEKPSCPDLIRKIEHSGYRLPVTKFQAVNAELTKLRAEGLVKRKKKGRFHVHYRSTS